jgi:flagellin-like hook-associated protein FlgL
MSTFPTAFSRTPNLLFTQTSLASLNNTNYQLLRVNQQLSTGLDLLRPSDDPIRSATVSTLDARLERSDQILRNLGFATDSLNSLDVALGDAKNLIDEALGIANEQISTPADAETRNSQATIVDSLIQSLFGIANRESIVGHIFGGTQPGRGPVELVGNAYRFVGGRGGLRAELGGVSDVPLTLGADNAIGAVSARVEGTVDLNPSLTENTRLTSLNGARSLGVNTGVVTIRFNGGATAEVDLTGAETVGDIADALEAGIRQYETDNGVTVLGPGGVSFSGGALSIDVPGGSLEVGDIQGSFVALDLGLSDGAGSTFTAGTPGGIDLDARLSWTTPISALSGLGGNALDQVRLTTGGVDYTVDLSSAQTLADVRSAFEAGGTNVVVEISEDGRSINVKTAVAGTLDQAMSISEISGGNDTATLLGVRTLQPNTLLSDFNDGRGVRVNQNEPDFEVTLGDGFQLTFDLNAGDIGTVQDLLNAINTQANDQLTAAGRPTTDFVASLTSPDNGIAFAQSGALGASGPLDVTRLNNSGLLEDLGFQDATLSPDGTTLLAEDRSRVRVDNLFTHLLDLASALRDNDTLGIEVAYGKLKDSVDRLSQSRSIVGGYGKRVDDEVRRQEDRQVLDIGLRSQLRDVDFAAASTRFSQLQLQLQAGLSVASQSQQLTLLDFLG